MIIVLSDNGYSFGEHRWGANGARTRRASGSRSRSTRRGRSSRPGEPRVGRRSGADDPRPRADERSPLDRRNELRAHSPWRGRGRPAVPGAVFLEWVGDEQIPAWTAIRTADLKLDPVHGRHRGALRPRRHRRPRRTAGDDRPDRRPAVPGRRGSSAGAARPLGECWIDWLGATRPHHPARPQKPRPEASSDPRCAPRRADRRAHVAVLAQRGAGGGPPRSRRSGGNGGNGSPSGSPTNGENPIEHVIFLVKENRSFDHYFGAYPGGRGVRRGTIADCSASTFQDGPTVPLTQAPYVLPHDLGHAFAPGLYSINGGKMNGYNCVPLGEDMTGYTQHSRQSLPGYWAYADRFVLADHFFTSMFGPTFPEHLYTVAAQSTGSSTTRRTRTPRATTATTPRRSRSGSRSRTSRTRTSASWISRTTSPPRSRTS